DETAARLFSGKGVLNGIPRKKSRRFNGRVFDCEISDGFSRYAAYLFGPLRGLFNAVFDAKKIAAIAFSVRDTLRHMILVETDTVFVHKVLILQTFFEDYISHGICHSCIR